VAYLKSIPKCPKRIPEITWNVVKLTPYSPILFFLPPGTHELAIGAVMFGVTLALLTARKSTNGT